MMRFRLILGALIGLSACIIAWILVGKSPTPAQLPHASEIVRSRPVRPPSADSDEESTIPDERIDAWLRRAGKDTPATLTDILALPDVEERNELLDWVISAWTTDTRDPALEWLQKSLPSMNEDSASETLELLIGSWALTDPLEAIDWVSKNLADPWREAGLTAVASSWSLSDPSSMGRWILKQHPPPDFWTAELIQGLIPTDPASAMEWCDQLADRNLATETREGIILSWQLSAPEEAAGWLANHPDSVPVIQPEVTPPRQSRE